LEDHSAGRADVLIHDLADEAFDGVVIPGGLGPEKLRQCPDVIHLVQSCYRRGKLCAAICHGQQVLISAGLMRGVYATAAWSMMDDLRAIGATIPAGERAIRDGQIVTAIFPDDLPQFFHLILAVFSEQEGREVPPGYPKRLSGKTWGIVVDTASDSVHVTYLRLRILEEGGMPVILGRHAGQSVPLSSPEWEWGEMGFDIGVERMLPDAGVIASCDTDAEANNLAIAAEELDGLLLPGGMGTWMIRGHPGLRELLVAMNAAHKPIAAIGRGPKLLLTTGVLDGRAITCAPQMRDDVIQAIAPIEYRDEACVLDDNLLTARGTEDLPAFMRTLLSQFADW
ncbi:MAG: DJ-1/PfpI family protein, partial [Anaerolineae bacterium]|nr:DJ-1/PfpI family protein [Anaerolineae bacterium]